jgi:hypothetical protein
VVIQQHLQSLLCPEQANWLGDAAASTFHDDWMDWDTNQENEFAPELYSVYDDEKE